MDLFGIWECDGDEFVGDLARLYLVDCVREGNEMWEEDIEWEDEMGETCEHIAGV